MIYDLALTIAYDYGRPSAQARNVLRLLPANRPGEQRRITGMISVTPRPAERIDRMDFFGNAVSEIAFHAPISDLTVKLQSRVERLARPLQFDLSPPLDRLAAQLQGQPALTADSPHHFLAPSPRIRFDTEVTDFVRRVLPAQPTALAAVQAVGQALHDEMRFDAEATDVDTPLSEAFANRHGVCQDFSHVMIAGLRSIGLPAGYVSGILRTLPPEGQARLEGADAMHAWVRVWCGTDLGWVEYDPTNDLMAGSDHVSVAVGRDYSDVAPIKGAVRSSGQQQSTHSVDLVPVPV